MKLFNSIKYLLALFIVITPINNSIPASASRTTADHPTPLVMVPGTHANQNRFDATFHKLKVPRQNVLKLTITINNQIIEHGTYNPASPIVVISFEQPAEYNIHEQANWLAHALIHLKRVYGLHNYNYVGHSNGGLVMLDYLEHPHSTLAPKLKQLITIGTPYNDIYQTAETNTQNVKPDQLHDQNKYSSEFTTYYSSRGQIARSIQVTLIYGRLPYAKGDGIVPLKSARAGQTIFGNRVIHTTQVNGAQGQHSQLPTSSNVIATIGKLISSDHSILPESQLLTHCWDVKRLDLRHATKNNSLTA
ncbi:alpha/beta hydrolase [Levilactobacillus enshiensis]|uniref:alpha/beta hydrolase n=1 Tax=Levilactobacillus enshiensis TaxID=2590213 RepID=UPI00117B8883|nr:alpha/beta hydrolase [Levilactobacillus enshiensis]